MKLTVILSSRDHTGRTARAADALVQGAGSAGAESRQIFLPELKIERCRQCDQSGWGTCRSEGRCVIEDDFGSLVEQIKAGDAVVFATPVYFGDLSESIRAFLDRLRRTCRHEGGREGIGGKAAVGICVAGGGGGGAPSCAAALDRVLSTCGFEVVDMIPARRQNLDLKQEVLAATGRWLAALERGQSSS